MSHGHPWPCLAASPLDDALPLFYPCLSSARVYASLQPILLPTHGPSFPPSPVLGGTPLATGLWAECGPLSRLLEPHHPTCTALGGHPSGLLCPRLDARMLQETMSKALLKLKGRHHPCQVLGHTLCHRKRVGWSNLAIPFPGLAQPQAGRRNALFLKIKYSAQVKYSPVSVFTPHR